MFFGFVSKRNFNVEANKKISFHLFCFSNLGLSKDIKTYIPCTVINIDFLPVVSIFYIFFHHLHH